MNNPAHASPAATSQRYFRAELLELAEQALLREGVSGLAAASTARALVEAEMQGLPSHGLSRLPQYISHMRHGRIDPRAQPRVAAEKGAGILVDAQDGLAYPACDLALRAAMERVAQTAVACAAVRRSHHFGMASYHLRQAAEKGYMAFAFSNSPSAMPAWGGSRALFGTNPIAAAFPRRGRTPISIDLSLSEVARGKLMTAARRGESIPLGWALDEQGRPTTDPQAGLAGMMCPAGGVKGAMLALMVELLCVGLGGGAWAFEADSFFKAQGNRPNLCHVFLLIDPAAFAGSDSYDERLEVLVEAMLQDADVRLPGERRRHLAAQAEQDGVQVDPDIIRQLRTGN